MEHYDNMGDRSSNENTNDLSDLVDETSYQQVSKVDCVIIGAGAAGLQCASTLLEDERNLSIVVLEARDRVGGRILTTIERGKTIGPGDDQRDVVFPRDHGAAWVHGADTSNPMMGLLAQIDPECNVEMQGLDWNNSGASSQLVKPVFKGNAWIRPDTILHNNSTEPKARSLISLFVDGVIVPDSSQDCKEFRERSNGFQVSGKEDMKLSSSSRSFCIALAIQRHYQLLHQMVSNYKNDEYHDHENVAKLYEELNRSLSNENNGTPDDDNGADTRKLVGLLTPFYLYLMENWNGISMKETGVGQMIELIIPDSDDVCNGEVPLFGDNHRFQKEAEEKKDDKSGVILPETDEYYVSVGDFSGPHCKVKTGMFTVLKPLIRRIQDHQQQGGNKIIHLEEEVLSVIDECNHVRVITSSGKTFQADCCVNTIPLGCLQHQISKQSGISSLHSERDFFQPRLSDAKEEAINSIWSGSYKKVFLTFDHIFWPTRTPLIGLIRSGPQKNLNDAQLPSTRLPGRHLLFYNLWAREKIPSIEVILCGNLGKWAFQKDDKTIQEAVIEFIEASMGLCNLSNSCIDCHVTRWEEDEFTRGSYSTFHLGTDEQHIDTLQSSEWDGRLIFAGEATESDHMGSVHAGLISGNRAAREVLDHCISV